MTMPDAAALRFQQGDAEWHRYRERCKTDLFFLSSVVLGFSNRFAFEAETHLLPTRFLERRTGVERLDTAPIQLALWPRETGKSSTGTIARSIQQGLCNPDSATLIAAVKAGLAQDFLKSIQHHFQNNALLRALFPEVIPPNLREVEWNQQRATLVRESGRPEPTFDTIGADGSVTGKHYDHIIIDDLIDKEVADSIRSGTGKVLRDINFWVTTLRPLLSAAAKPFPCLSFLGTRWWIGDTYDFIEQTFGHGEAPEVYRLKAKLPSGKVVTRSAYRVGDLAVMRIAGMEEGVEQFPKIWPSARMETYRRENPELFAAFVQNDPSDAAVRTFQDAWLHYWTALDRKLIHYRKDDGSPRAVFRADLAKVLVVDPAFTSSGSGSRSAIVVTGTDRETAKHLVLDVVAERVEPRDLAALILDKAKEHGCSRVFIEAVAQQRGFIQFVESEARRRNLPVSIEEVRPSGRHKDVRIEGLAAYFKSGQILCHSSQHSLLEEYRHYKPGAPYRDVLDALAYCSEKWIMATPGTGSMGNPQERVAHELSLYKKRRGLISV